MEQKNNSVVICPPCGENVALATKRGANKENLFLPLLPRLTAVLPPQGREMPFGFTLIELLVVVLIIGILAAVAVPQYQKAVEKSRAMEVLSLLSSVNQAQQVFHLAQGFFTNNLNELDISFPYDSGTADTLRFQGGGYEWNKCANRKCLYAVKAYKGGFYSLQVMYETGNYNETPGGFICIADENDKALEICRALGFYSDSYRTSQVGTWGSGKFYRP